MRREDTWIRADQINKSVDQRVTIRHTCKKRIPVRKNTGQESNVIIMKL